MAFKLKDEVDQYFRHLTRQGYLPVKFDIYYLCLMMGLAAGSAKSSAGAHEFVKHFVDDYAKSQRLIIGLLVYTEARGSGLDVSDRDATKMLLSDFLDHNSHTALSAEGVEKLNDYAQGGFLWICKNYGEPPHQLEAFLTWYLDTINGLIKDSEIWKATLAELELG